MTLAHPRRPDAVVGYSVDDVAREAAFIRNTLIAAGTPGRTPGAVRPGGMAFTVVEKNGDRVTYQLRICGFDSSPRLGIFEQSRAFAQGGAVLHLGTTRHGSVGLFGRPRGVRGTRTYHYSKIDLFFGDYNDCRLLEGRHKAMKERGAHSTYMAAFMEALPTLRARALELPRHVSPPRPSAGVGLL